MKYGVVTQEMDPAYSVVGTKTVFSRGGKYVRNN